MTNFDDFYNWIFGEYNDILKKEKEKLPYHVNLLELFRTNENANSRVLSGLFRKPEILQSLFKFIGGEFAKLKVNKPQITNEEGRIDILIKDDDYSLIIENKIHGAQDRPKQLSRYIDYAKFSRKEENIYILYCTLNFKEPSDQSWGDTGYKEKFKNRFYNLTFRHHILPWLQDIVLPKVKNKDIFLKSYIEQYVDYLQGLLHQRKFENNMHSYMKEYIKSKIKSTDKAVIDEYADAARSLYDYLNDILQEIMQNEDKALIQKCYENICSHFNGKLPKDAISLNPENDGYPQICVRIHCKCGIDMCLCLETDIHYHTIYYGFHRNKENENNPELKDFLNKIQSEEKFNKMLTPNTSTSWWYLNHMSNKETAYSEFIELIENLMQY